MLEASARSRGKAIVSVNRRYKPEVLATKRLVLERGGAVHVAATYNKPLTSLGTPEMAGIAPAPIICDAIHHVDLLRWLAGPALETAAHPTEVYAESWQGERPGSVRYDATVLFETGCRGVMMSHYGVGFRIQRGGGPRGGFFGVPGFDGRAEVCALRRWKTPAGPSGPGCGGRAGLQ